MDNSILEQLIGINKSLQEIAYVLNSQSFWNSQLFAAIIGALSAIFSMFGIELYKNHKKRITKLNETYKFLIDQLSFHTPDNILKEAIHDDTLGYLGNDTGEEIKLGERMVIRLMKDIEYDHYPCSKLKILFFSYEKSLKRFSELESENIDDFKFYVKNSEKKFNKIERLCFKNLKEDKRIYWERRESKKDAQPASWS
ncbi:hypothetical protein [Candidatus Electrothrix sp.]|uniref:hypothetical protein n=1 Tax=Candidatus Electrothrix sp. TaxID=2170559 RepID=UPI004056EF33